MNTVNYNIILRFFNPFSWRARLRGSSQLIPLFLTSFTLLSSKSVDLLDR